MTKAQRVIVSGFLYKNGKCLVVQRGLQESFLPGYWENPGGKLDFGEDLFQGVQREVKEETGLDVEVIDVHHTWHWISEHNSVETQFVQIGFIVKPLNDKVILEKGMNDYRWITKDEIDKLGVTGEMKKEIESGFRYFQSKKT
jgi:8-oxo-dGTP diphosphatase